MGNKNIQNRYFDNLGIIGLLFCFSQFFADITFPFARRLRNIPVLTEIFYNIIIVHGIVDQWQYGT